MSVSDPTRHAEGLLEQIADTALDDDYYVVRPGPYKQSREFNTVLTGVVLGVFALLVCIAAIQTRSDRPTTERERETLISDVDARKTQLANREKTAERLRAEVRELSASVVRFDPAYQELRLLAAAVPVTGPGITVRIGEGDELALASALTDNDLRVIVNALWYAGAEAISVNGKRLGTLSAIRTAEGVIKVNYQGIAAPYVIEAIGDKTSLADRFEDNPTGRLSVSGGTNADLTFDVTPSSKLKLGAVPSNQLKIRSATAPKEQE